MDLEAQERIKNIYSDIISIRTYHRFNESEGRRETWDEVVDRYKYYMLPKVPENLINTFNKAMEYVRERKVMPSMRALWTAGLASDKDNVTFYNCSFIPIIDLKCFSELMYLLMNGVGVGISVERQFITKLDSIEYLWFPGNNYVVEDSKEGWATAFLSLLNDWNKGLDSTWDISKIRPKGSPIKTFGGRASGGEVLEELFRFTRNIFFNNRGQKLTSDMLADIACKTAEIVLCGGVRRSAIIIFSNLSDLRMRDYKVGDFYRTTPYRCLANISAVYDTKPSTNIFLDEISSLIKSNAGERGIVNISNYVDKNMRLNPCAERILKPFQLCNLSEVVVHANMDINELYKRVKYATLLGTLQATMTEFNHDILREEWKTNTIEDALLGVSMTGTSNIEWNENILEILKNTAIGCNENFAKDLNINKAAGITCLKPSGTVSQLVGTSAGIHPEYAPYYIRRLRISAIDPLCLLLQDQGVPNNPEVGEEDKLQPTSYVFEFPIYGTGLRMRPFQSAIEQLEVYKLFKEHWCDSRGNPSCTVYVKESEWIDVIHWINTNFDIIGGVSFLPYDNGIYKLAPYEEVTKEKFEELCYKFPEVDLAKLSEYELQDSTTGSKELSCSSGSCELI